MLCVASRAFRCLSHCRLSCPPIFCVFLFPCLDDFIESAHQAASFANMKRQHRHQHTPKSSIPSLLRASITLRPWHTPLSPSSVTHVVLFLRTLLQSHWMAMRRGSSIVLPLKRDELTGDASQVQTTHRQRYGSPKGTNRQPQSA